MHAVVSLQAVSAMLPHYEDCHTTNSYRTAFLVFVNGEPIRGVIDAMHTRDTRCKQTWNSES